MVTNTIYVQKNFTPEGIWSKNYCLRRQAGAKVEPNLKKSTMGKRISPQDVFFQWSNKWNFKKVSASMYKIKQLMTQCESSDPENLGEKLDFMLSWIIYNIAWNCMRMVHYSSPISKLMLSFGSDLVRTRARAHFGVTNLIKDGYVLRSTTLTSPIK